MVDLVSAAAGVEVHPSQPVAELRAVADRHGVRWEPAWGSGKIIEELFETLCEARVVRPTFVTGHPVEVSPLARLDPDRPAPDRPLRAVRRRQASSPTATASSTTRSSSACASRTSRRRKDAGDLERGSVDEDYLRALEYGMPPTGGLGVGIDRLVMLLAGVDSIKDVILFPTLRPSRTEPAMSDASARRSSPSGHHGEVSP